jgi:hypothetical protein
MTDNIIIEFGHGRLIIDRGAFGATPAIFISPLIKGEPVGVPGEKAPGRPPSFLERLIDGETVFTFPSVEQRDLVYHALLNEQPPSSSEAEPNAAASEEPKPPLEMAPGAYYMTVSGNERGPLQIIGRPLSEFPYGIQESAFGHVHFSVRYRADGTAENFSYRGNDLVAITERPPAPSSSEENAHG